MKKRVVQFKNSERAQGMVEYGIILAIIAVVTAASLGDVGYKVGESFGRSIDNSLVDDDIGLIPGEGIGLPTETPQNGPNVSEGDGQTEGMYTEKEMDQLVKSGNIPIASAGELNAIRSGSKGIFGKGTPWENTYQSGLDKHYIQVSTIDMGGYGPFEPLGDNRQRFSGVFDGGGYETKSLNVDGGSASHVGFFGYAYGATIKNVGLVGIDVRGQHSVGGLVGHQDQTTIKNSYSSGKVSGNHQIGGLVGYQQNNSSILSSYAAGSVHGNSHVGGLVGYQYNGSSVTDSYAASRVEGIGSNIGGLVGYQVTSSLVENSYATGEVSGISYVGGLLGYNGSSIVRSGWANDLTEKGVGFGSESGVIGQPKSDIDKIIHSLINTK